MRLFFAAKRRAKLAEQLAASKASAADLAQQAENAKIRAEQQAAAAEAASVELAETVKKLEASEAAAADLAKQVDDAKKREEEAAQLFPATRYQKLTDDIEEARPVLQRSIGPRGFVSKGFLAAVLTTNTCCTAFLCMIVFVLYQHSYGNGVGEVQPRPPPPPSLPISSSCTIYHAGAAVFEGVMHTMTADGFAEVEAEEGDITTGGAFLGFSNPFAPTFFDFECLLANGTGDPCDAYVAEAFADQMFVPLRTDSLVGLWLSTIFLYSLAQIGGIPRPRFIDRRIDWPGTIFWLSWMLTQLCQFFVVGLSLAMQVVAFFGVHERTGPCLVSIDNVTLLDEYATITFAAQPALLSKLLLLTVYGYLLSLGALVFIGRNMNEVDFKEEASKTKTSLVQPIPITSVLYFISRWALYGICLGTVGGWLGSVASWAAALVAAAVGSHTGGFRRGNDWPSRATIAKFILVVLLALPILPNLVYLPLGALFLAFVKLSFAAGRWALDLIDSTAMSEPCCPRLEALTKAAAAATKPAISWLTPLGSLELTNGMSMVVQGLAYTETSLSTLAGGLACVLGCLALSPLVAYGTWAAEQGRLEPGYDVEDSAVEAVQARGLWMLWVLEVMLLLLFAVETRFQGKCLGNRCHDRGIYLSLTSDARLNVLLTIYAIPFLLALGFDIFFTSLDDSYIERVIRHAHIVYGDSFAFLATLQLDVSGLQPFLDSVMVDMAAFTGDPLGAAQKVADRLAEIAADPLAPVREVVEVVANMSRYLDIDPAYFVEHSAALDVLNIALGLLKLLATYGRKAFALYDVVLRLFSGENEEGDEEDDGVVQVHECVADPKKAQLEADVERLRQRGNYSEDKSSLDLPRARLAARDAGPIALWLKNSLVLTDLNLRSNDIGPEGAKAIAEALRGNAALTHLDLYGNKIGDEGAVALGKALEVNQVLKNINLLHNNITVEGAALLVKLFRERRHLESLCGFRPDQTKANVARLGLHDADAMHIGADLRVNKVLTKLHLHGNKIGSEGSVAIGKALAVNRVLTKLNLDGHELDLPKLRGTDPVTSLCLWNKRLGPASAIVIASLIAGNKVLTNLVLWNNSIGDEGAKALAAALRVNEALTDLNLRTNEICNEGAAAIAEALRGNAVLKSIHLLGNNITMEGAATMCVTIDGYQLRVKLFLREQRKEYHRRGEPSLTPQWDPGKLSQEEEKQSAEFCSRHAPEQIEALLADSDCKEEEEEEEDDSFWEIFDFVR